MKAQGEYIPRGSNIDVCHLAPDTIFVQREHQKQGELSAAVELRDTKVLIRRINQTANGSRAAPANAI